MISSGCSTLKDSLILGAGSGAAVGAVTGANSEGDKSENTVKGAVIGGVVGGLASYFIHSSLESRDAKVRRNTLMNLEKYEVLGVDSQEFKPIRSSDKKCVTTQLVDNRLVSVPCNLASEVSE